MTPLFHGLLAANLPPDFAALCATPSPTQLFDHTIIETPSADIQTLISNVVVVPLFDL